MEKLVVIPIGLIIAFVMVAAFGSLIHDYAVAPVLRKFRKHRRPHRGDMP